MPLWTQSNIIKGLVLLALSACATEPVTTPHPPLPETPTLPVAFPESPGPITITPDVTSTDSQKLRAYYARLESDLLSQGLLRTDGGGPDTPYTDTDLIRDFTAIAFYDEYASGAGLTPAKDAEIGLPKWLGPVRIQMRFGPSVDERTRRQSQQILTGYVARLVHVTGHPITLVNSNPNFTVMMLGEDDRKTAIDQLKSDIPNVSPTALETMKNLPKEIHCLVATFSGSSNPSEITKAVALIRAEHPPLTQKACIHEEIAQGLGLVNDSPKARPSIFNDDDEFALLTTHDEDLLRMLYSPRLRPGMSIEEATPTIRELARMQRPGNS